MPTIVRGKANVIKVGVDSGVLSQFDRIDVTIGSETFNSDTNYINLTTSGDIDVIEIDVADVIQNTGKFYPKIEGISQEGVYVIVGEGGEKLDFIEVI